jgi:diaminopimelate epimerase
VRAPLPFTKCHGLGNDYLLLDAFRDPDLIDEGRWVSQVRAMCARRRGVGADGVILFGPDDADADAFMRIFNADTSEAQRCGNGARCVARLLAERFHVRERSFTIRSADDILGASVLSGPTGGEVSVSIDMGTPILDPSRLPVDLSRLEADPADDGRLTLNQRSGRLVGVGNPHLVLWARNAGELETIGAVGPPLETHPAFPERMNVHLAHVADRSAILLRSWERGAGLTQACGTGACAAFAAARMEGLVDESARVNLPGGDLVISEDLATKRLTKTGPAVEVFSGQWPIRP